MLQRQADAVQSVNHAVAAEAVDLKRVAFAAGIDRLVLQIDHEFDPFVVGNQLEQFINLLFAQSNRQQLVVERVAVEDIGEAGRYHHFETVIGQCPRSVLA
ncbi:hypothetical protein D3C76_1624490 [compost metagenome]